MSIIHKQLLFGRISRLSAVAVCITACAGLAYAQTEDAASPDATPPPPPYALFQNSTLTGSGNAITAVWVPVVTSSGTTYKNVTLLFNVDSLGNLTVASGYPHVVPVTPIVASKFKAGKYAGPSTIYSGEMLITVSGPGVTSGGATEWSLSATSGASGCTYPDSATWYVGPLANSPLLARLKKAGITSTAWSYGIGGAECNIGGDWYHNSLLGFSQIGNKLTIVSFTNASGDQPQPVDTIVYTVTTQ